MDSIKVRNNGNNAINNVMDSKRTNNDLVKSVEQLGGNVLLWLSMHDTNKTLEVLKDCEEKADESSGEILHDLSTLIKQFQKAI